MFTDGQPVWRNWQTHKTQNLAGATSCGFKSHRRHKPVIEMIAGFFVFQEHTDSPGKNHITKNRNTLKTKVFMDVPVFSKASDGNRTRDLLTTNEVRYRLCHASLPLPTQLLYYKVYLTVKGESQGFYFMYFVIE